jgi:hypothetical protein
MGFVIGFIFYIFLANDSSRSFLAIEFSLTGKFSYAWDGLVIEGGHRCRLCSNLFYSGCFILFMGSLEIR